MQHVDASGFVQHHPTQVLRATRTRRAERQLAGILLTVVDQLAYRVHWQRSSHGNRLRRTADDHDGREILLNVEGQIAHEKRKGVVRRTNG